MKAAVVTRHFPVSKDSYRGQSAYHLNPAGAGLQWFARKSSFWVPVRMSSR